MTGRTFRQLRFMGAVSAALIVGLGVAMLYFAGGTGWRLISILPTATVATATPLALAPTQTTTPTITPVSVWAVSQRSPAEAPPPTAQPLTSARISTARDTTHDAHLRFVHAAAAIPMLDLYLDGVKMLESRPYRSVSSYFGVPAGEHQLRATTDGREMFALAFTLLPSDEVSLVATPERLVFIQDDNTFPEYGHVRVRLANMAENPTIASSQLTGTLLTTSVGGYYNLTDGALATRLQTGSEPSFQFGMMSEMGTVYTLWVFGTGEVAASEDAQKVYALLPVTGS